MRIIIEFEDGTRAAHEVPVPSPQAVRPESAVAPAPADLGAADAGPAPALGAAPTAVTTVVSESMAGTTIPGESAGAAPGGTLASGG